VFGATIVVIVVAWLGLCAYRMVQADHDLRQAVARSEQLRASLTTQELTNGGATPQLREAATEFRHAHSLLSGSLLTPLRWVPVAGRQLNSAIDLSDSAGRIAAEGTVALDQVHTLLNAPHHTPQQRAAVVQNLASVVARLDADVASVNLGPSHGLIGTLAAKRNTFANDLSKLQTQLGRAKGASSALATLVTGPRKYLVFSANNAEMRAGSGMFLSAGTLSVNDGTLTLSTFTPTWELVLPTAQVPLTGDLASLWGYTEPNQEFRNLELSPQFPASAALAAQMWQARTGQHVDGVLVLDVGALSDILSATGQVTSDGQTFDAQTIIPFLLNGQYQGLSTDEQQAQRHERDGNLAAASLDTFTNGGGNLGKLATALGQAADGRHVLVWDSTPKVEAEWQAAGVGGVVGPGEMLLSVLNQGASKLDPFMTVTSKMTFSPNGKDTTVTVTVHATNEVPAGQPAYVNGDGGNPPVPGTYAGAIQLDIPGSAGNQEVLGHPRLEAAGPDGDSYAMAVPFQLGQGASTTVTFRFVVGTEHGSLRIDPSARMPATQWSVENRSFTDDTAHVVSW